MKVYAVKTLHPGKLENRTRIDSLYEELKSGRARFGWSYENAHALPPLESKINDKIAYSRSRWLLKVEKGDHFVYINMPSYDKCTIVQITEEYQFTATWFDGENDFRHMLECEFISTFDRSANIVPPVLKRLLKLQGSHYEIKAYKEYEELLENINTGKSTKSACERVDEVIRKALTEAAKTIYSNYAGKPLEPLVAEALQAVPGITIQKGSDVGGDDLVLRHFRGLPLFDFSSELLCAVQVKAYMDDRGVIKAIDDIRKALKNNPDFSEGMIVTTATNISIEVEALVEDLAEELNKPVYLIDGIKLAELAICAGIFRDGSIVSNH